MASQSTALVRIAPEFAGRGGLWDHRWERRGEPQISESSSARVLIVAYRTAATPGLIEAVRERARQSPCSFALLVPVLASEELFGDEEAKKTLELAIPLLEEAAGGAVSPLIGPADALLAVERTLVHEHFDEVIISTLPERVSHWLRRDLPAKVERLGVPVTVVRAKTARRPIQRLQAAPRGRRSQ